MQLSPPPAFATLVPTRSPLRSRRAISTLVVLAGVVGETLGSYNTPPIAFITNPAAPLFNLLLYGAAALFIREVVQRRRLGWGSWVLLGTAYSALNEGVGAAQWFVPHVSTLPAGYGHALGVNWSWLPALAIFHTVYSMVIPIALTEACFSSLAQQPWLGRRGFVAVTSLLVVVGLLFCLIPIYQPGRLAAFGIVIALTLLALRAPTRNRKSGKRDASQPLGEGALTLDSPAAPRELPAPPGLWRLRWAGFGLQIALFAVFYIAPRLLPPVVTTVLLLAFAAALATLLRRWTTRTDWSSRQTVALATGAFGLTFLLALIPPVFVLGEGVAEIAWFIFLARLAAYTRAHPLSPQPAAV